jgi:hypothetical protein
MLLGCALAGVACTPAGQPERSAAPASEPAAATAVRQLSRVRELPEKAGLPFTDPHAKAVLALGKQAAPYLVQAIPDTTPTGTSQFFVYSVGDVAVVLLIDIYKVPTWPFPSAEQALPVGTGDFRDYVAFMSSADNRQRLKQAWQTYVDTH